MTSEPSQPEEPEADAVAAARFRVTSCDHGGQNFEVHEVGVGVVAHLDTEAQAERITAALIAAASARTAGVDEGALEDARAAIFAIANDWQDSPDGHVRPISPALAEFEAILRAAPPGEERLRAALAFARSCVLGGEQWTAADFARIDSLLALAPEQEVE